MALLAVSGMLAIPAPGRGVEVDPGRFKLIKLDLRFDRIVANDMWLEKIAEGFMWVEGPAWNREGEYLLFSDIPSNAVFKWKEGEGVSRFLTASGYTGKTSFEGKEPGSNGLTFDPAGRLVLCQHGDRRIARLERNGRTTSLAERYEGKRLNSPNDLVFKSNGDLYFTDRLSAWPRDSTILGRKSRSRESTASRRTVG